MSPFSIIVTTYVFTFIMIILAIIASYFTTQRKGYNSWWILLNLITPLTFIAFQLLSNKNKGNETSTLCTQCEKHIVADVKVCPYCGNPISTIRKNPFRLYFEHVVMVVLVFYIFWFIIFASILMNHYVTNARILFDTQQTTSNSAQIASPTETRTLAADTSQNANSTDTTTADATNTSIPACDSERAKAFLMEKFAQSPMARAKKLTIVDLSNIITVLSTDTVESCGARATCSDQSTHIFGYSLFITGGQLNIFFIMGPNETAED